MGNVISNLVNACWRHCIPLLKPAFNASTPALAQALFMCVVQIFCWNGMEANRNNTNWNEWKKFSRLPNFEQVEGDRMAWAESNSDTCCINWQGNTRGKKESSDVGFKWFRGGREICWSGGGKLWAGWGLWSYLSAAVAQPSFLIQRNPPPHNSHLTIHPVFSHHIVIQSQIEAQVSWNTLPNIRGYPLSYYDCCN